MMKVKTFRLCMEGGGLGWELDDQQDAVMLKADILKCILLGFYVIIKTNTK